MVSEARKSWQASANLRVNRRGLPPLIELERHCLHETDSISVMMERNLLFGHLHSHFVRFLSLFLPQPSFAVSSILVRFYSSSSLSLFYFYSSFFSCSSYFYSYSLFSSSFSLIHISYSQADYFSSYSWPTFCSPLTVIHLPPSTAFCFTSHSQLLSPVHS